MSCLDEKILYEFSDNILEGNNKEEVEKHLKECEICKKKLDELKAFDKDLKFFWKEFRKSCPSPEDIYEYSMGRLGKKEAEKISEHLESCQVCKIKYEESEKMAEELEKLAGSEAEEEISEISLPEEKKRILEKMAETLNLAKKSRAIMESLEKLWRANFSYSKPIGLRILEPCFGRAFEMADIGEGYEKEVIQEEGSPFQVEIVQFGKQLSIILDTETELFKNSIVRFKLYEKEEAKFSGTLFVSDGIGKYIINLGEKDFKRPEKVPYKIRLDVISYMDILADIKVPASSQILMELMKSGNAKIRKSIIDILGKKEI